MTRYWIEREPGIGPHIGDIDADFAPIVRVFTDALPFALGEVVAFFVGEHAEENAERFVAATETKCLTTSTD